MSEVLAQLEKKGGGNSPDTLVFKTQVNNVPSYQHSAIGYIDMSVLKDYKYFTFSDYFEGYLYTTTYNHQADTVLASGLSNNVKYSMSNYTFQDMFGFSAIAQGGTGRIATVTFSKT